MKHELITKFHWQAYNSVRRAQLVDHAYLQKFTELIVRECIDYCGENLSKTVGEALKIHFGVEE